MFTGSLVAIVTPMRDDGGIDLAAWERLLDWHAAEGTAGIVVGGVTVIVWKQLASLGGVFELYELLPGFLLSALAIVLVSRLGGGAVGR